MTRTFRTDSNVTRKINDKAKQEDVSINTLVNQILKRYVEWGMHEGNWHGPSLKASSKGAVSKITQRGSHEHISI
jgi:hypothetical protein